MNALVFEYVVAAQAMCFRLHFDGDMAQSVVFYAVALGVKLWLLGMFSLSSTSRRICG